jgi:hypothetical protein
VGAAISGRYRPTIDLDVSHCGDIQLAYVSTAQPRASRDTGSIAVEDAAFACTTKGPTFEPLSSLSIVFRPPDGSSLNSDVTNEFVRQARTIFEFLSELYAADLCACLQVEILRRGTPPARITGPVIEAGPLLIEQMVNRTVNLVALTAQLNQLWWGTVSPIVGRRAGEVRQGLGEGLGLYLLELTGQDEVLTEQLRRYEAAATSSVKSAILMTPSTRITSRIAFRTYHALSTAVLPVLAFRSLTTQHWKRYVDAGVILKHLETAGLPEASTLI